MIRAKNYEKLSKFVKVTAKTLSVPFFQTRFYILICTTACQKHPIVMMSIIISEHEM